ncbi:MAG TPA: hypothetical protein VGE04_19260 [Chloroflexia bacterium]|jgi:hypothetical protein
MAIRSKHPRPKWRRPDADDTPPAQQEQAQAPATGPAEQKPVEAAPAEQPKPANVIRKGIYLSALIYVEGDVPAPDDFISPATNALKSVLAEALKGEHDGLGMTLKKVEVRNDVEQEDEEAEGGGQGGQEKFQF